MHGLRRDSRKLGYRLGADLSVDRGACDRDHRGCDQARGASRRGRAYRGSQRYCTAPIVRAIVSGATPLTCSTTGLASRSSRTLLRTPGQSLRPVLPTERAERPVLVTSIPAAFGSVIWHSAA